MAAADREIAFAYAHTHWSGCPKNADAMRPVDVRIWKALADLHDTVESLKGPDDYDDGEDDVDGWARPRLTLIQGGA